MDRLTGAWFDGVGDEVLGMLGIGLGVLACVISVFFRYRNAVDNDVEDEDIPPRYNQDECPVCISAPTLPVETNCGHMFCGLCLRECYRHQHSFGMHCPLCRSQVNLVFVCFVATSDIFEEMTAQEQEVYMFVGAYNRGAANFPLSIWQMILDWPTTMRHFWNDLSLVGIVTFLARARILFYILATLLYILSPLDVVPEALLGIMGYVDDLIILAMLALHVSVMYRRLIVNEGPPYINTRQ